MPRSLMGCQAQEIGEEGICMLDGEAGMLEGQAMERRECWMEG